MADTKVAQVELALLRGQYSVSVALTLRDYFAAQAMPSIYAAFERFTDQFEMVEPDSVAMAAYAVADAMLQARAK